MAEERGAERTGPIRILVIEDDPAIAKRIVTGLKAEGFETERVFDGAEGSRRGLDGGPDGGFDLVVLDLHLPGMGGLQVLESWSGRVSTPVIVLTSSSELSARLSAFDLGAVDYMPKPFWVEELVARIKTRLRLFESGPRKTIAWNEAVLDLDARELRVGGALVPLTGTELNVLAHLATRPGRAVTRAQLAEAALPAEGERFDRTVDGHVSKLRRKLNEAGGHGAAVRTVWGVGYRFDADTPPKKAAAKKAQKE